MPVFHTNIDGQTKANDNFREVIFTGLHSQLVLMSLKPGEEIGNEVHEDTDQFFRVEAGKGKIVADNDQEHPVSDGDAFLVVAGTWHNVINTYPTEHLKLYTIYSPAHHPDGTVNKTKAAAEMYEKSKIE